MKHQKNDQDLLDSILDRLDDSCQLKKEINIKEACSGHEDLIPLVTAKWSKLIRFDALYGEPSEDQAESFTTTFVNHSGCSDDEIHPSNGRKLFLYSEITLDNFHDSGGLSEVYKATDSELMREVALKMLRPDRMHDDMRVDFNREAEILARMNHPGIVAVFGKGETIEGRPFYSMPFLNKGSFAKHIDEYHKNRPQAIDAREKEFRDLLVCLVAACKSIAYAHSKAVVHRDIKAENIMLGNFGETLVIDWGCARVCKRDSRFKLVGVETIELRQEYAKEAAHNALTPRYASPEQLRGSVDVGPESDIYSLGGTLYKLLTGHSPYHNVPDTQIPKVVLSKTPIDPQHFKRGIPKVLASICKKAMQFEPSDRYETAMAMADDLERYLGDLKTSVEKKSTLGAISRAVRRNPRIIAGIIGAVTLFGFVMTLLVLAENSARSKASEASKGRLEMAAAMAALAGGAEIESRFALLDKEAINPELIKAMQLVRQSPSDRTLWTRVQSIIDQKSRELKLWQGAKHESLFVISDDGTQIARSPYASDSIGGNYAYRDYFHGQGTDLPKGETPPPALGHVLSAAYQSSNKDGKIRTALSVPIRVREAEGDRILGRLCMSVPINSLEILDLKDMRKLNVQSMLVDMRDYDWNNGSSVGLVLDGFKDQLNNEQSAETINFTQAENVPRLPPEMIQEIQHAMESDTNTRTLVTKSLKWGAARSKSAPKEVSFMPIRLPHHATEEAETGWIVLLME